MFAHARFAAPAIAIAAVMIAAAAAWAQAGDAPPAAPMDHAFARPAERDTARLDLDDVLRRVLARNPSVDAARAAWAESRARARAATAWDDPMLDLAVGPSTLGGGHATAYRLGLSEALPISGRRGLERRAGLADAAAAGWELETLRLDLVRDARVAYAELWRIERRAAWNAQLRRLLAELHRVALAQFEAGKAGQQDPLRVDAETARLDHEAVMLERDREVAAATLNALMHTPADAPVAATPERLPAPDTAATAVASAASDRTGRPELRAAEARAAASRARERLAARSTWPEPTLAVAYDRFWSEPQLRTSVGVTVPLPFLTGRPAAERAAARARVAGDTSASRAIADSIDAQFAAAEARLHEQAHDVTIVVDRMLPLAERGFRAAEADYESGRTDFQTALGALRDLMSARLEADDTVADLFVAAADRDRALGTLPPGIGREVQP